MTGSEFSSSASDNKKAERACGSWPSPVTASLVAGKALRLSELQVSDGAVFWLESRPAEAGRGTLMRRDTLGALSELTPAPLNIGTNVHEYGGGAYSVRAGALVAADRADNGVWLFVPDAQPRLLARVEGLRFADFDIHPAGAFVLCVREDHRAPGEPKAAIVALPLDAADPRTNSGTVLVEGPDFLSSPRCDPTGTHLAWITWDHPFMPWERTILMTGRLHGSAADIRLENVRPLTDGTRSVVEPRWQGTRLLACSDESDWWNLYQFDPDGLLPPRPLAPMHAEIGGPHWVFGTRSYQPLADGTIVALAVADGQSTCLRLKGDAAQSMALGAPASGACPVERVPGLAEFAWIDAPADGPPAIVLGAEGETPRIIQASAPALLGAQDIAHATPIRFPLHGGGEGHAFFYPPTSAHYTVPDGEKPPLVVMIHGGPTARADEGFSFKIQWWTSRGFAVVDVNYGGSTGFGLPYRRRLDGGWGEVDVEDCIAACQFLIARAWIDPTRIVIRGSSAGGLTVLNALARGTIFAAGTSIYGVTDLTTLAQDTHKFESRYLDGLVGPWPEARTTYEARSPLNRADHIDAPVLFLHGLDDPVVPIAQARDMAQRLHARGVRVASAEFPNERHGFRNEVTIRRALELELAFYGRVLGFIPDGAEDLDIPFL